MPSSETRLELAVTGMRCAGCSETVGAALKRVPGVESADVSFAAGLALVRGDPGNVAPSIDALVAAVRAAGYDAVPAGATEQRLAWRGEVKAAGIAAAIAAAAMAVDHFGEPVDAAVKSWSRSLLALAAIAWPGASFLRGAWQSVKTRHGNMDLLIAVGAGAAALSSLLAAAGLLAPALDQGHAAIWLVAFLRVGKLLEARVRAGASSNLLALLDALPARAVRLVDGVEQECDASDLAPGQRIVVPPSERIAADGFVVAGRSTVDEAAVTGEPVPAEKEPGAAVFAGTVNHGGRLVVEVSAAGGGSRLGQMAALVRRAVLERAPVVSLADRIAARFVPAVLLLAVVTTIGWWLARAPWETVLARALSTVVISCPCALALATPTAVLAGAGAALRRGVLVKDGGVLEALARVRAVLFDKTGTLTRGRLSVSATLVDHVRESEVGEARALAAASRHPAAAAVAAALERRGGKTPKLGDVLGDVLTDVVEAPGRGIRARRGDHELKLGRPEFAAATSSSALAGAGGATLVAFARDGELKAAWALADELRPGAVAAVFELRRRGLVVELVTGDRSAAAQAVGRELGLDDARIHGDCTPTAKAALVATREHGGTPVLFVGDGFNDGAALAAASVGAAVGGEAGGTELAREAGRVTLLRGDPRAVVDALDVGRATVRAIRQNLLLAFAYNVVAIPWAMGLLAPLGFTSPEPAHAGLAMAASSLAVVLNAFRLSLLGRLPRP